jgi:hypothetical protein
MTMTGRQRAIAALNFQPVDRAPIWGGWITKAEFLQRVSGISYWDDPWGSIAGTHRRLGVDLLPGEVYGPFSRKEFRSADFQRVTAESAARYREPEDVLAYVRALPDPASLERSWDHDAAYRTMRDDVRKKQDQLGDDMLWLPVFRTCYFNWHVQFGYEPYLMALGQWPGEMKKLFDHAGEVGRLDNLMRAALFRDEGLPLAMFNGVDLCSNRGPIVSVELLRRIYFPNLKRSLQPLVDAGFTIIWHSDGYITPLIEDLVACGVRGFQGFQEECGMVLEDLPRIRLPGGRKPALWGSMSVSRTLPRGTVADVKREVERSIDILGPGGGFFLGTTNTVGPEVPDENLLAMHEHAHTYGAGKGF